MKKFRLKPSNDPRKDWITLDFGGIRARESYYSPALNVPIDIEAEQFYPHKQPWPAGVIPWPDANGLQPRDMSWGYIDTSEGRIHVQANDWIVTDVSNGERYICKPNLFEKTFEPAE